MPWSKKKPPNRRRSLTKPNNNLRGGETGERANKTSASMIKACTGGREIKRRKGIRTVWKKGAERKGEERHTKRMEH